MGGIAVILGPQHAEHPGRLGGAVHLVEVVRERVQAAAHQRPRHGGAAVPQAAHAGQVGVADPGQAEEELVHGRDEKGMRQALLPDLLQDRGRRHLPHHEGPASHVHALQRPAGPADVEQRHGHQVDAGAVEPERLAGRECVGGHAPVGEHRALGITRRSRRVQLQEALVRPRAVLRRAATRRAGQQALVLAGRPAQHDHMPQAGQLRPDLVDGRRELGAHDRDHGTAVGQHVAQLLRGEPPVDHRADKPALGGRKRDLEVCRVVLVQHRDPLAGLHAQAGQGTGETVDPAGELGPGPGPFSAAQRLALRRQARPVPHDRAHVAGNGRPRSGGWDGVGCHGGLRPDWLTTDCGADQIISRHANH